MLRAKSVSIASRMTEKICILRHKQCFFVIKASTVATKPT